MSEENNEWKELKIIIRGPNPVDKLKIFNTESLSVIESVSGRNLLHVSVKHCVLPVTKYLIGIGCDVNHKDNKNGRTPLSLALKRPHRKRGCSIKVLLENGADVSWTNVTEGQSKAIDFGCNSVLKTFRNCLQKIHKRDTAKFLLDNGWPLDGIASLQHSPLTKLAIKSIPELQKKYDELIRALKDTEEDEELNFERIVRYLESVKEYKIITGFALWSIVQVTNKLTSPEIIKLLLKMKAPIEGVTGHCESPLGMAIANYNIPAAWTLLDHGAELLDRDFKIILVMWILNRNKLKLPLTQVDNVSNLNILLWLTEHRACHNVNKFPLEGFYSLVLRMYFLNLSRGNKTPDFVKPIIEWKVRYDLNEVNYFYKAFDSSVKKYLESHKDMVLKYEYKCKEEISKMKEYKICNISIYDLLVKPIEKIVPYTRNEKLMEKLRLKLNVDNFEINCGNLWFKINKADEKRQMIDGSIDSLSESLPLVGSSLLVIEKIVDYLGFPNELF